MSSQVALRIAYFALNLVGGLAITITFFILCLNIRHAHDGPFLMSIALCLSRIISAVISCLLLISGAMTGNAAPRSVCIAQSGLHASQGPLLAFSILSYAVNVLLMMPPPSLLMGTVATTTLACLLLLPFLTFAAVGVVSALIASQNPENVNIRLYYCFLDQQDIKYCSAILAGIALLATMATISRMLYLMRRKDSLLPASGSRWLEDIVLQIICLGLYATTRLGFLVANSIEPNVAADMLDAADSVIIFIILGTQPWLFKKWLCHVSPSAVDMPPHDHTVEGSSTDRRHDALLQRVSEYPSVIDIRRTDPMQGGQVGRQTPKLRALSAALELAANDPYTRYHGSGELAEKRATIVEPELQHHPCSLDAHNIIGGSRPSLKSFEYGVAFGHPSRDASMTGSLRPGNGTPTEGRAASLIIISTPSETSSHALHLPLDEDAQSPERPKRTSLSPLATAGPNTMQRHSRRTSDASQPHTPRMSFERNRRGQESPLRALCFGISTESVSSGLSPRTSRNVRTSLDPPPSHSTRRHPVSNNQEYSNGEGSMRQYASSESSGHILGDDIASSVLSWPNLSRSTLQLPQERADDIATPASAPFSHSSLASESRWPRHFGDTPEEPPHPAFLRDASPSPLSLNDEGGSVGANTFGGPSPVERRYHPYTRGPSPLRPPGLGSPLYGWTEEIEETKRKGPRES